LVRLLIHFDGAIAPPLQKTEEVIIGEIKDNHFWETKYFLKIRKEEGLSGRNISMIMADFII
jgi:hypothetical protein